METQKLKSTVAWLSVASNTFLVIIKLGVGFAMGSISVISEAIHSGVDILAAFVAVFGVRRSDTPADEEHAFGHGKYDNLSGLIQAILIFIAAGWILWEAITKLIKPTELDTIGLGVLVMLVSSVVNGVVGRILNVVAKKTDSVALKADAWHCWTDVYASAGVMIGLSAVWAGEKWLPGMNWHWVDPVAAIAVAVLIVKTAWDLTTESVRDLLDVSLPVHEVKSIKEILNSKFPRIMGYHNFRTRKSGNVRFVEFHIMVDPKMTVEESHMLHHAIAAEVKTRFRDTQLIAHIEPCLKRCKPECTAACLDPEKQKQS